MDGRASNADNAKSGGEASPSAGGKPDGRIALDDFSSKQKRGKLARLPAPRDSQQQNDANTRAEKGRAKQRRETGKS